MPAATTSGGWRTSAITARPCAKRKPHDAQTSRHRHRHRQPRASHHPGDQGAQPGRCVLRHGQGREQGRTRAHPPRHLQTLHRRPRLQVRRSARPGTRFRRAVAFSHEVIPGITSIQALTAAHRIALNHIGGAIHITTGRRLRDSARLDADNTVVMLDGTMLDGTGAFDAVDPTGLTIHWGAYLGTDAQLLIAGPLREKAAEIARARAEARERHGWIMDTYLLRRSEQ